MTAVVRGLPFLGIRLTRLAEIGDVDAQFMLGMRYLTGNGVSHNGRLAQYWLNHAARAGHRQAMIQAGILSAYGDAVVPGTQLNTSQALDWYEKARQAGNQQGALQLALLYMGGHGVEVNYARAEQILIEAEAKGHTDSGVLLRQLWETLGITPPLARKACPAA